MVKYPRLVMACLVAAGLGGCLGTPRATYDWKFSPIRADASDRDKAFAACEALAKRRANRILAANLKIWTFASTVEACMRDQGWQTDGKPVTVSYI